jgi:hypothetical protein
MEARSGGAHRAPEERRQRIRRIAAASTVALAPLIVLYLQVRGDLSSSGEGWKLVPRKIVGGFELPENPLLRLRDFVKKGPHFYRTYRRRLRERS